MFHPNDEIPNPNSDPVLAKCTLHYFAKLVAEVISAHLPKFQFYQMQMMDKSTLYIGVQHPVFVW